MAKVIYPIIGGGTHKAKTMYGSFNNATHKVKKMYNVVGNTTKMCYGGGLSSRFITFGSTVDHNQYSEDGITWKTMTNPIEKPYSNEYSRKIAYGNNRFVCSPKYYSLDGVTWTTNSSLLSNGGFVGFEDVVYYNGKFYGVIGDFICTSSDGIAYDERVHTQNQYMTGLGKMINFKDYLFITVCSYGTDDEDDSYWLKYRNFVNGDTSFTEVKINKGYFNSCPGDATLMTVNGYLVAIRNAGSRFYYHYTTNGTSWTTLSGTSSVIPEQAYDKLRYLNSTYYGIYKYEIGSMSTIEDSLTPLPVQPTANQQYDFDYGNGKLVVVSYPGLIHYSKDFGVSWTLGNEMTNTSGSYRSVHYFETD